MKLSRSNGISFFASFPGGWLCLGTALLGMALVSQAQQQPNGDLEPVADPAADPSQGVYVRDSANAIDRFALAERLERLGDWAKAADVYQEVVGEYGDRLIARPTQEGRQVAQYVSIERAVQERLAAWPGEGLEVYRQRFGPAAQAALEDALASERRVEALGQVVRLHFVTDAARDAGISLIDLHMSEGRFAAALKIVSDLLDRHPGLGDRRAAVLLRGVTAAHFSGDEDRAAAWKSELIATFPEATGLVAGSEHKLAEVAEAITAMDPPSAVRAAPGNWPTFAGSDDRARVAEPLTGQIAPYATVEGATEVPVREQAQANFQVTSLYANARREGQMTGIFPVAYDGTLYWSDNVRVYATSLDSGLPVSGWLATHGETRSSLGSEVRGAFTLPGGGFSTPHGLAILPTVTQDAVFVMMGLSDPRLDQQAGSPSKAPAQLVCLDRETGRLRWSAQPTEAQETGLGDQKLEDAFRQTVYVGSPLVVGDRVWTMAHTSPQTPEPFEQSYLVSLDAGTGEIRSVTYLASASRDTNPRSRVRSSLPEATSPLAFADGLIYAATDAGALAAVRASDATVEWLNVYPRRAIDADFGLRRRALLRSRASGQTAAQPFHMDTPIITSGRVFYLPGDAEHLFVFDAVSGVEKFRVPLEELEGDRTLLGLVGPLMVTFGSEAIECLDWTVLADALEKGTEVGEAVQAARRWVAKLPLAESNDAILGRPALSEDRVLVPLATNLAIIDLRGGKTVASYPPGAATWDSSEGPGNVVILGDQVVVAGPERLNIYADDVAVRQRLEQALADDPTDPNPHVRIAQIDFVQGNFDTALRRLRSADEAARNLPDARRDENAGGAFGAAIGFAQTLQSRLDQPLTPGDPEATDVDQFFELAGTLAATPGQQVQVRLAQAKFERTEGGAARRVALLQEILSDAAMRDQAVPDADTPGRTTAGAAAAEMIGALRARHGQEIYATIETRARTDFEQARDSGDVDALLELTAEFPNSQAAGEALAASADLLEAQGRLREASGVLRQLTRRPGDAGQSDEARLDRDVETGLRLAQMDLKRPDRLDVAAGRMRRLARLAPDRPAPALTLADGSVLNGLTVEQAAFEVTRLSLAAQEAARPSLDLPTDPSVEPFEEPAVLSEQVRRLLTPEPGQARPDRVLAAEQVEGQAQGKMRLVAFEVPQGRRLWATPVEAVDDLEAAWTSHGLLLWSPTTLRLIEEATGKILWTRPVADLADQNGSPTTGQPEGRTVRVGPGGDAIDPEEVRQRMARAPLRHGALGGIGAMMELREMAQEGRDVRRAIEQQAELEAGRREIANIQAGLTQGTPDDPTGESPRLSDVLGGEVTIAVIGGADRVAGLDARTGEILWRAPRPPGELRVVSRGGDFVALLATQAQSHLYVYDLDTGTVVTRRIADVNGVDAILNMIVTPGNQLVYVTPRRVTGVDLDADPDSVRFNVRPNDGQNAAPFVAAAGPGRIGVVGNRLLVYADPRLAGRRDVMVIDLAQGLPEQFKDDRLPEPIDLVLMAGETDDQQVDVDALPPNARAQIRAQQLQARRQAQAQLAGGDPDPLERMWISGTNVYLTAQRGLSAYDMELSGRQWRRLNGSEVRMKDPAQNTGVAIADDSLLLWDVPQSTAQRPVPAPTVRLNVFSRARLPDGRESGQKFYEIDFHSGAHGLQSDVAAWQAHNGGVTLLEEEGRLLLYPSAAAAGAQTTQPGE